MATQLFHSQTPNALHINVKEGKKDFVFDSQVLQDEFDIPSEFILPNHEKPSLQEPVLKIPPIDMKGFLSGDPDATADACLQLDEACRKYRFFLVVNHGVDSELIAEANKVTEEFFTMKLSEKQRAKRELGDYCGYASSFTGRFASRLPWKETLTYMYYASGQYGKNVERYFVDNLGEDFRHAGEVLQRYCDAMSNLCLKIMELLGMSLGVGSKHFREFFEGNESLMRMNYYPKCQEPGAVIGTASHGDPNSLTILHQDDHIDGLQVSVDGIWYSVPSTQDSFVVNIGDTFEALSNGIYKSCLHRAVLNDKMARKSLAFFLSPRADNLVTPPKALVSNENPRMYPDFTWRSLFHFTQKHHRVDHETLDLFFKWLASTKKEPLN